MNSRKRNEEKRKKKVLQYEQSRRRRESKVREILTAIKLDATLRETPLVKRLLKCHCPKVQFVLGSEVPEGDESGSLCEAMKKILKVVTFDCPQVGPQFLVTDYFEFVVPIVDCLRRLRCPDDPAIACTIAAAQAQTLELESDDTVWTALKALISEIESALIIYNRMTKAMYYVAHDLARNEKGQRRVILTLRQQLADEIQVTLDGKSRPAFRCGAAHWPHEIDWCVWRSEIIGVANVNREYRIYSQWHVFDQLQDRLGAFCSDLGVLHEWLWQSISLATTSPPRVSVKRDRFVTDTYWVDFLLYGHRVGYVVATLHDDTIILRTFLFLTMQGTPEQMRLHEAIGLTRSQRELLSLDSLDTFVLSDIQSDAVLSKLFEDCGCGHLFRMLKEPLDECSVRKMAEQVKKHLGLGW